VLRLADDSFVHVSFHNQRDDEVNPIASTAAFAHFQQDHSDRREGPVDQQTVVGAYFHHDRLRGATGTEAQDALGGRVGGRAGRRRLT
jgi:hypothetical protein